MHCKSHFADDSGNCFFVHLSSGSDLLRCAALKTVEIVSKSKISPHSKEGISYFPSARCIKRLNSLDKFLSFFILANQLSTDPWEFQFYDIFGQAVLVHHKAQALTAEKCIDIHWDAEEMARRFSTTENSQLKAFERRQWPQTQLKDTVTGLFNTKWRLFLRRPLNPSWRATLQFSPLWQLQEPNI